MIVFCEECGERNVIDPALIKVKIFRCQACNDVLKIYGSVSSQNADDAEKQSLTSQKIPLSKENARMEIRFQDRILEVSQNQPVITIGRQEHNDLEIIDTRVSRSHARIEYRKGDFVLIDQSTNGTYVYIREKKAVNVRKDELMIDGTGVIGLGRKVDLDSPEAVHFSIKR